jgi:hypothetical protein
MARKTSTVPNTPVKSYSFATRQAPTFEILDAHAPKRALHEDELATLIALADAPASCTPTSPEEAAREVAEAFRTIAALYGRNGAYEKQMAEHLAETDRTKAVPAPKMDGDIRVYVRRMEQMGRLLNRLCGTFLSDAIGACEYWRAQQAELREMHRVIGDTERDDRPGVAGFANAIERKETFVATLALRAIQTTALAKEARRALRSLTGDDFEPFVPQAESRAPTAEAAAARKTATLDV